MLSRRRIGDFVDSLSQQYPSPGILRNGGDERWTGDTAAAVVSEALGLGAPGAESQPRFVQWTDRRACPRRQCPLAAGCRGDDATRGRVWPRVASDDP